MTDIATLGLKVDSSQVGQATDKLDEFAEAAQRAEAATVASGKASESAAAAVGKYSTSVRSAALSAAGVSGQYRGVLSALGGASFAFASAAVAVGVISRAYLEGAREAQAFARAIAVSGNAAGVNVGQLTLMARAIAEIEGTQGKATEALAEFAATGKVGAENLKQFAQLAVQVQRSVGTPIAETAKQFAELAEKPTKAAAALQKSFNFLTPVIYENIRAQEKAGNVVGAAAIAQKAFADELERQKDDFKQYVPTVVRGWNAIADTARKAWDAMLGVGRQDTPETKLADLQAARLSEQERQRRAVGLEFVGRGDRGNVTLEAGEEEKRLIVLVAQRKKEAEAITAAKAATDAYIRAQEEADKKAKSAAATAKQIADARLSFDVGRIRRELSSVEGELDQFNDVLEAQRNADLISDKQYYEAKRRLIESQTAVQTKALQAEIGRLATQGGTAAQRIALQNKIADNEQRIGEIQSRTGAQLAILAIDEGKSLADIAQSYADAQASADRYVQSLIKRFQIESKGFGLGEEARSRLRDRAEIEDRFEERRQTLDRERRRGDITQAQYDKLLKIESDALAKSESAYEAHYEELIKKQGSWAIGAAEALQNFVSEAKYAADAVQDALSRGFNGAADALAEFAMTGKGNFKGLAESIIADLLRIQTKIALSNILQSVFGAMGAGATAFQRAPSNTVGDPGFVGPVRARANGGPVTAGAPYLVGERGPELIVPQMDGYVIPNGSSRGSTVTIQNTNYFSSGVSPSQVEQMLKAQEASILNQVFQSQRRGRAGS